MLKALSLVSAFLFLSQGVVAQTNLLPSDKFEVVVPVVNSPTDIHVQAGAMFYDIDSGLKVINNKGQVENATFANGNAVTSGATTSERVERLTVSPLCSSSPCTISDQSGSWVSSVTRAAIGQYNVNFVAGTFSATPTCIPNSTSNSQYNCSIYSASSTSVLVVCIDVVTTSGYDSAFNLICMGTR